MRPDQYARETLQRIDPAWAHGAERLAGPVPPLVELFETLQRRREQVEAGDTLAILQALDTCCRESVPAPTWLAQAFTERLGAFTQCPGAADAPTSLDETFCSPYLPAGLAKRTRKARADWAVGCHLWRAVHTIAPLHRGLDKALEEVLSDGSTWPVRKSRARQLVLMIEAVQVHLSSGRIAPLSRLWAKSKNEVSTGDDFDGMTPWTIR